MVSGEVTSTDAIVKKLITEIAQIAMSAQKTVVLSFTTGDVSYQEIKHVPDYRTRLDAASRLIGIFVDAENSPASGKPAGSPAPSAGANEEFVQEVETLRTRSLAVRRSSGRVAGGCHSPLPQWASCYAIILPIRRTSLQKTAIVTAFLKFVFGPAIIWVGAVFPEAPGGNTNI